MVGSESAQPFDRVLQVVRDLAAARDLPTITRTVRRAARALTGADGITFVLRAGDECSYVDEDAIAPLWKGRRFPMSACVSGWVMQHGEPALVPDIYSDPRVRPEYYRLTFVKSLAMVPVRRADPVAAVGAYWAQTHVVDSDELNILTTLADTAALALANISLHGDLRFQEDLTRVITQNATSMILMMDPEGRGTYVNPEVTRTTGYAPSELIGQVLHEKLHYKYPDGRPYPVSQCPLDRALPHEHPVRDIEEVFVRKDGTMFPVVCSATPIVKDGRAVGTVLEVRDVTAAHETARLKDQFLAVLSHELRTPLNTILGWAHILSERGVYPDEVARAAGVIERNAALQARLVEDLLDVSSAAAGRMRLQFEEADAGLIVQDAVESVRAAAAAKEINVTIDGSGPARLTCDPPRVQQIIRNLLSNAVKFTPPGGRIHVSFGRRGNQLRISVSDSGIGIRSEYVPHLFECFAQADGSSTREHAGMGLGLALARAIAEAHDGTIEAHSEGLNRGSQFTVILPVTRAEALAAVQIA